MAIVSFLEADITSIKPFSFGGTLSVAPGVSITGSAVAVNTGYIIESIIVGQYDLVTPSGVAYVNFRHITATTDITQKRIPVRPGEQVNLIRGRPLYMIEDDEVIILLDGGGSAGATVFGSGLIILN